MVDRLEEYINTTTSRASNIDELPDVRTSVSALLENDMRENGRVFKDQLHQLEKLGIKVKKGGNNIVELSWPVCELIGISIVNPEVGQLGEDAKIVSLGIEDEDFRKWLEGYMSHIGSLDSRMLSIAELIGFLENNSQTIAGAYEIYSKED